MNHEKWVKLSDESKNIKVAELDGWTKIEYHNELSPLLGRNDHFTEGYYGISPNPNWSGTNPIPDYLNDLNAMHRCVSKLSEDDQWEYRGILIGIVGDSREAIDAIAAQRAEAFVLAMEPE
jgi:hypothetical protein